MTHPEKPPVPDADPIETLRHHMPAMTRPQRAACERVLALVAARTAEPAQPAPDGSLTGLGPGWRWEREDDWWGLYSPEKEHAATVCGGTAHAWVPTAEYDSGGPERSSVAYTGNLDTDKRACENALRERGWYGLTPTAQPEPADELEAASRGWKHGSWVLWRIHGCVCRVLGMPYERPDGQLCMQVLHSSGKVYTPLLSDCALVSGPAQPEPDADPHGVIAIDEWKLIKDRFQPNSDGTWSWKPSGGVDWEAVHGVMCNTIGERDAVVAALKEYDRQRRGA